MSRRRKGRQIVLSICSALIATGASLASAAVPERLFYQGRILNADGTPREGSATIQIGIWDAPDAGSLVYGEIHVAVSVRDGIFTLELGTGVVNAAGQLLRLNEDAFAGPDRYLEVAIDGEVLRPRQRIGSVGFALQSQVSERAGTSTFAEMAGDAATVGGVAADDLARAATLATHAGDPSAHHTRTSSFAELGGQIADLQIPDSFTRDAELAAEAASRSGADDALRTDLLDEADARSTGDLDLGAAIALLSSRLASVEASIEFCGDGDLDPGEECDDGNPQDGDGCSAACSIEVTCRGGAQLVAASPDGRAILCDDPTDTVCEEDFETLCPVGWGLCTPLQFNARNDGWAFTLATGAAVGEIYCRVPSGAGHFTLRDTPLSLGDDVAPNCLNGSSRPSCPASFGCNERFMLALCCAPIPTCGDGLINLPEEECDDGNRDETDDCLNSCSFRVPAANGVAGLGCS